ncbi:MAG: 1-acyl-sn-glycerol-3-phosphate acyltransferase [Alphaproteobacteria bacterium]|nr:1-acyl-sn-glycerol-3-phosphate acyltransferase [Alphaproteobacteria bacterium]
MRARAAYALQYIMSLLFTVQIYAMMVLVAVFFIPPSILSRNWAFHAVHTWCNWVRFSARWMVGLRSEVRGEIPVGEVLVCAKHQSFFDVIILVSALPRPRFVMKAELKWAPILGFFAMRMGCIAINRGRKAKAVQQMIAGVETARKTLGQLVIYPQGTRVAAGAVRPYKIGSGILYKGLKQDCIPTATNVGVFWPRHGIYRKPGLAIVEFLPAIKAGKPVDEFMAELEAAVEVNSNRLMAEVGFRVG